MLGYSFTTAPYNNNCYFLFYVAPLEKLKFWMHKKVFILRQNIKRGHKPAFIAAWACSGLQDSLRHRSFAGLTTQTQTHHNKFDKGPESVYRETEEPHSDRSGIRADILNTAFPLDAFCVETSVCSSSRVEPQCIIQPDENCDTVWAQEGGCIPLPCTCCTVNYTEGDTCKSWNIKPHNRASLLFPSSVSYVEIHVYMFTRRTCIQAQETNLINVIIMKLPAKEAW